MPVYPVISFNGNIYTFILFKGPDEVPSYDNSKLSGVAPKEQVLPNSSTKLFNKIHYYRLTNKTNYYYL